MRLRRRADPLAVCDADYTQEMGVMYDHLRQRDSCLPSCGLSSRARGRIRDDLSGHAGGSVMDLSGHENGPVMDLGGHEGGSVMDFSGHEGGSVVDFSGHEGRSAMDLSGRGRIRHGPKVDSKTDPVMDKWTQWRIRHGPK